MNVTGGPRPMIKRLCCGRAEGRRDELCQVKCDVAVVARSCVIAEPPICASDV